MAKLKAPLMSLGASGQLGKALVFFPWKGLNVVREFVTPSNPQTAAQNTQRAYMTAAVAKIHEVQAKAVQPLTSADQVAYSTLAAAKSKIMTWFNQISKLWIDVKVAGNVPIIYSEGYLNNTTANSIDLYAYLNEETGSQLAAGKFYFGSSKTNLVHSAVAVVAAGFSVSLVNTDLSAFLTAGVKYYWQFRPDAADPCEGADSGIYNFVAT